MHKSSIQVSEDSRRLPYNYACYGQDLNEYLSHGSVSIYVNRKQKLNLGLFSELNLSSFY